MDLCGTISNKNINTNHKVFSIHHIFRRVKKKTVSAGLTDPKLCYSDLIFFVDGLHKILKKGKIHSRPTNLTPASCPPIEQGVFSSPYGDNINQLGERVKKKM